MSNLLVGCKASGMASSNSAEIKGIIVGLDKYTRIMDSEGKVTQVYSSTVTIHPDDVKFIMMLNKNYKLRKEMIENQIDRFEILDL